MADNREKVRDVGRRRGTVDKCEKNVGRRKEIVTWQGHHLYQKTNLHVIEMDVGKWTYTKFPLSFVKDHIFTKDSSNIIVMLVGTNITLYLK